MVTYAIGVAAYVAVCIWLGVRRMEASGTGPKTPRGRLRELGWSLGLLALAISMFGLGANRWGTLGAVAIAGLVLILGPWLAGTLVPAALVALGLYGFWVLRAALRGYWFYTVLYGVVKIEPGSWQIVLILPEAHAFLGVGLWLLWRQVRRRSGARGLLAWPVRWRWLLLPVTAMLMELFGPNYWMSQGWGSLGWNAAFVVITLILALRVPAAAADLAAAGLVALGLYGIAEAAFWPYGAPITTFYTDLRYGVVLIDSRQMAIVAGVQGCCWPSGSGWPRARSSRTRGCCSSRSRTPSSRAGWSSSPRPGPTRWTAPQPSCGGSSGTCTTGRRPAWSPLA